MKRTGIIDKEKYKIGFDLHGVIDTYPEMIYSMMVLIQRTGNQFCIVSGPRTVIIQRELANINFTFPVVHVDIYSVVDFLQNSGVKTWKDEKGDVWADEQNWWDAKAKISKKENIDYMIDDSEKYRSAFELTKCKFIHINELLKGIKL